MQPSPAENAAGAPAAAPALSLTERYEAKLDAALGRMAPERRVPELVAERARWIARYERFVARVDAGEEPHWGETAFDYLTTIAALDQRIGRLRRAQA